MLAASHKACGALHALGSNIVTRLAQSVGIQVHAMDDIEQLLPEQLVTNPFSCAHHCQRTGFVVASNLVEGLADSAYRVAHRKAPSEYRQHILKR
jgi:hypothetical protein